MWCDCICYLRRLFDKQIVFHRICSPIGFRGGRRVLCEMDMLSTHRQLAVYRVSGGQGHRVMRDALSNAGWSCMRCACCAPVAQELSGGFKFVLVQNSLTFAVSWCNWTEWTLWSAVSYIHSIHCQLCHFIAWIHWDTVEVLVNWWDVKVHWAQLLSCSGGTKEQFGLLLWGSRGEYGERGTGGKLLNSVH